MNRPSRALKSAAVLLLVLAAPEGWCNWGADVGRASPADANRLALDKLALQQAESKYNATVAATQKMMINARQRQLLGSSYDAVGDLYRHAYLWWLKSVLEPAALIATNPAATCAEARMGYRRLIDMQRQRQLIGLATDPDDHSQEALERSGENTLLEEIGEEIHQATVRRCHEEALDECVESGRYQAVFEQALSEMRQDQLLSKETDLSWMQDALGQCARYELKFSSSGGAAAEKRMPGYKRRVEGTVPIHFDPGAEPMSKLFAGIGGLAGSTQGSASLGTDLSSDEEISNGSGDGTAKNPWLSSHECLPSKSSLATLAITACGPGRADADDPTRVSIKTFDLKHISYELDPNEAVRTYESGEDKLIFEFEAGKVRLPMICYWQSKLGPTDSFDIDAEVFAESYRASHTNGAMTHTVSIQRAGDAGPDVAAAGHARRPAGYPDLFVTTISGTGRCRFGVSCNDSTEFTLTHKPQPKPFTPRDLELRARIDALISTSSQAITER